MVISESKALLEEILQEESSTGSTSPAAGGHLGNQWGGNLPRSDTAKKRIGSGSYGNLKSIG